MTAYPQPDPDPRRPAPDSGSTTPESEAAALIAARLPAAMPDYMAAQEVQARLDAIEANDLEGKLTGLATEIAETLKPRLDASIAAARAWREGLSALVAEIEARPAVSDRRALARALAAELAPRRETEQARVKTLAAGWKPEIKETKKMERRLKPRGEQDGVYQTVRAFRQLIEAQFTVMTGLPKRLEMAERSLTRLK